LSLRSIALAAAVILAACSGERPDDSATLHRGNRSEPLTLDPHTAHLQDARFIIADMFVGLYEPGPDGRPVRGLAESVEVSGDGLVWTFGLRQAQWSDATPITAGDVVAGLRRALDPDTMNQYPTMLFMIENARAVNRGEQPVEALGATAVDPRTVELRLEYPAPYLPSVLMLWGQPLPRHAVAEHGPAWIHAENIVTSGPFHLVEWRADNFIHLRASDTYYDADDVCLDNVYYYPTVDTAAAERRVRNGELDLNTDVSGASLEMLRRRNPEIVETHPGVLLRNLILNTSRPPFDDARVRRALSLSIDREFLAGEVLAGADRPAWRIVGEGVANRPEGVALDFAGADIEARRAEARRLLEEAGFGPDNPLRFNFFYTPAAGWPRVAPVIQADWSAIAPWVDAALMVRETQLHYAGMRADAFAVGTAGWLPDFDDPYGYLLQWRSDAGDINYSGWSDPDYDALLDEAIQAADPERRAALMAEAEQLVLDAAPIIPVYYESSKMVVGERVQGWVNNPWRLHQSRWLCVE
jgi:oligopeptide transport system substrate-binding protein